MSLYNYDIEYTNGTDPSKHLATLAQAIKKCQTKWPYCRFAYSNTDPTVEVFDGDKLVATISWFDY